jgi:tetrahydromethanopterin S-methyltransferase subunit H
MFKFQSHQEQCKIGDVWFGGQPGKRRTVMVGSMFYPRHSMVLDRVEGIVDKAKAKEAVEKMKATGCETGCPAAVMLFAETDKAMRNHIQTFSEMSDLPFFVDSPSRDVRLDAMRFAKEIGLEKRAVYNTMNAGVSPEELAAMKDAGVENSVLLAFNPMDLTAKGKIYLLEDGGGILKEGLIDTARKAGVKNILLDMAVLAAEQNAGSALRALFISKAKWGLPCGCALHNAVESYTPLLEASKADPKLYRYVDNASCVMPIMAGADFVMYGPIESSRRAMYSASFADELLCQATADIVYEREPTKGH